MHDADSHIMEEPDWLHPTSTADAERFPYVWSGRRARAAIAKDAPSRRHWVPPTTNRN